MLCDVHRGDCQKGGTGEQAGRAGGSGLVRVNEGGRGRTRERVTGFDVRWADSRTGADTSGRVSRRDGVIRGRKGRVMDGRTGGLMSERDDGRTGEHASAGQVGGMMSGRAGSG